MLTRFQRVAADEMECSGEAAASLPLAQQHFFY